MSKPIAVLISDVHFTIQTLEEAAVSFLKAQFKAKILNVPLIIAGDLLDAKAIMRAECVNKIIALVSVIDAPEMIFIVGNHDKINEKSEAHSLNFLKPYATVIDSPRTGSISGTECMMIPYQHDNQVIKNILDDKDHPPPKLLIIHQGVIGSKAGHYIQDKSACPSEWFADYRVISGHYHERQHINCGIPKKGAVGFWSYLGNPYTLNFSEANTEKGYNILHDDGHLEFVRLDLRQHIKLEYTVEELKGEAIFLGEPNDIVWVKITGTKEELAKITKKYVAQELDIEQEFKLELIPTNSKVNIDEYQEVVKNDKPLLFDTMINSIPDSSDDQKKRLKTLWKDLIE